MAKYPLDPARNLIESLEFWLQKYLTYKAMTLGNHKADREKLDAALAELESGPHDLDGLKKIAARIRRAGVGVSTQFVPVERFVRWMSERSGVGSLADIDEETAIRFLTVATASKSDATKVNYKNALSGFFDYVSRHNAEGRHLDIDLSVWQRNARNYAKRTPPHLTDEQVERLFEEIENHDFSDKRAKHGDPEPVRALYRFLFRLLYLSGLRISEALALKLQDFSVFPDKGIATVRVRSGKGNKERTVSVPWEGPQGVKDAYREYMAVRTTKKGDQLFMDPLGRSLYVRKVNYVFSHLLSSAGINVGKSGVHLLRHTHASYVYRKTGDILYVKERLGHESVKVTERYTHIGRENPERLLSIFSGQRNNTEEEK
jgi:integrase/recombinase XerD